MIHFPDVNTYLSITSSIDATLIRFTIKGGLVIRWWRTGMKAHSVTYLHRQWKVGTGFLEVIKTPRGFGLVAIAITTKTLLIAAGPILQQSVDRVQRPGVLLSVTLPERLPYEWAGRSNIGSHSPSRLLDAAYHGFALQTPVQINVSSCEGRCQLETTTPAVVIQESDCISQTIPVQRSNLSAWRTYHGDSSYILFWARYSTQFFDTPQWFGPEAMKPTQPLPAPPAGQETVAFYVTGVDMTNDAGIATNVWSGRRLPYTM